MKNILINLSISLASIFTIFLIVEFVLFRFIIDPGILPKSQFVNGIVKYEPHQQGVYRQKNYLQANFKINADGWNSNHDQYLTNIASSKRLVAIVGDSFVEGFHVDFDKSFAERLETNLGGENFQVYRFGISGAPMSQYLQILRQEVVQYHPDLIIVLLTYNDFDESYLETNNTFKGAFLKLVLNESGNVIGELPPSGLKKKWYTLIKNHSATWRYLSLRQKVRFQTIKNVILGKKEVWDGLEQKNNSDPVSATVKNTAENPKAINGENIADYIFEKMKTFSDNQETELIIVIDGDRKSIYRNFDKPSEHKPSPHPLNVIAKEAAKQNGIHFIDLHPIFENDFYVTQTRFEFTGDGHWNEYSHKLISNAIYSYIKEHQLLPDW